MIFDSITLSDINYEITGSFSITESQNISFIFDLGDLQSALIIEAFYSNNIANILTNKITHYNSIVLHNEDRPIYVHNPIYSIIFDPFGDNITLSKFSLSSSDYFLINSDQAVENLKLCEYTATFEVRSSFDTFFHPDEINESGRLLTFESMGCDIKISTSKFAYKSQRRLLTITISSEIIRNFDNYESLLYVILELMTIVMGHGPSLIERTLVDGKTKISYYRDLVDRYHRRNQNVERQIKSAGKSRIKIMGKLRFFYLNDLKSLYYTIKSQIIIM